MTRISKVEPLSQLASRIPNGAKIAVGGAALHFHPMAILRELVRQGKQNFTVIGEIQGIEADFLCGAGAAKQVESSGVGLERFGVARNFKRAVESGTVRMKDYSDTMSMDRLRAAAENLPFWPLAHLYGTDLPRYLEDVVEIDDPFSGRKMHAMKPAEVDFAILHAPYADEYGNIMFPKRGLMPTGQDITFSRAAQHTLVSVEQIVPNEVIQRNGWLVRIPGFRVDAVVEAPYGAHPSSCLDFYDFDTPFIEQYVEASISDSNFQSYLKETLGTDEAEYLEGVGVTKLLDCRKVVTW